MNDSIDGENVATPNDLKISDSEAGRGSCRGEGAKAAGKEQLP